MSLININEFTSTDLSKILYNIYLQSPVNLFDAFIIECQKWYSKPAHSIGEIKTRDNKKLRGDIFEKFCVLYLKNITYTNNTNVWLLSDVPDEVLTKLSLKRRDMGIDIIVEIDNKYIAVQCKYKKHTGYRKNVLSWKVLSTFYAMCLRTGPWDKYIVMTNCEYVLHQGKKTSSDISICLKTFQNTSVEDWIKMCNLNSSNINKDSEVITTDNAVITNIIAQNNIIDTNVITKSCKVLSIAELRAIRIKRFNVDFYTFGQ